MLTSSLVSVLAIWLCYAISVHGHDHHHHQQHQRNLQDSEAAASELTERVCGTPEPTEEEILKAMQVETDYFESLEKQQQQNNQPNNHDFIPTPSPSPKVTVEVTAPTPAGIRGLFLTNPFPGIPSNSGPTEPTPMQSTLPCPTSTPFSYTVPTVYHVISPTAGPSPGTDMNVLQQQHAHMNNAFCGTGFQFDWVDTTQTINDSWYQDDAEQAMKAVLRKGGRNTLNVYLNNPGGSLLGYAYFPTVDDIVLDGVTINDGTLPGGKFDNFNEGDTLVHEVGHWLGLFHTFERGCSLVNDGIADTPAEMQPNQGCPRYIPDSCTTSSGLDPINNFMDYSHDTCMFEFTPGQINRMVSQWNTYRA